MYFGETFFGFSFLDIFFVQFQFSQNTFQVKNPIFYMILPFGVFIEPTLPNSKGLQTINKGCVYLLDNQQIKMSIILK